MPPDDRRRAAQARRIALRPACWSDLPEFTEIAASNADVPGMPWSGVARTWGLASVLGGEAGRMTGRWLCVVERRTGRTVGIAAVLVPNPADGTPWIDLLILHRDAQGRGLGSGAALAIESRLRRRGWDEVRLSVHPRNPAALRFWQRLGYVPVRNAWRSYDSASGPMAVLSKAIAGDAHRAAGRPGHGAPRATPVWHGPIAVRLHA